MVPRLVLLPDNEELLSHEEPDCFGRDDLTVSTDVKKLTSTKYRTTAKVARAAHVAVDTQPIRITLDGTDPSNSGAGVGQILTAGSSMWVLGTQSIQNLKMIRSGGSDGYVHVEYFG